MRRQRANATVRQSRGELGMRNGTKRGSQPQRFLIPAAMIAAALVVVVVLVIALHGAGSGVVGNANSSPTPALQGGPDMQGHPAPPFALRDQNGNMVSLQSLRGHPIVLTFMDATCTEQCPLMVQYLNWAAQKFMTPQQVAQVEWVTLSVNPNNTPADVSAFMAKNKPVMPLRFLLGTQNQLRPLWKAYYIAAQPGQSNVVHSSGLYIIDQQGRERIWMDVGFNPKALAGDLKALLATPS